MSRGYARGVSLNQQEMVITSSELQANLSLCGLSVEQVAADLVLAPDYVRSLLALSGAQDPADVWLLRDYLEQAVVDSGGTPRPFTVLTEDSRHLARRWFRLREAPRHAW